MGWKNSKKSFYNPVPSSHLGQLMSLGVLQVKSFFALNEIILIMRHNSNIL